MKLFLSIVFLICNCGNLLDGRLLREPTTPIVLWHGMGDVCCNPLSMGYIKKLLEENIPGVYVLSLRIGANVVEDFAHGFFMNVNDQVKVACEVIGKDEKLRGGYNALGFSQGGVFLRAVAQRCPSPGMLNLVSIGGPQQGVYGFPRCPGGNYTICDTIRKLLTYGAYSWIQQFLVQAQYWHSPLEEETYRQKSAFLADINGEQDKSKRKVYKENLVKLNNFIMVKFSADTMVQPKESEWFGFYKPLQTVDVTPLAESDIYKEDWLGLKVLNDSGKLHFLQSTGDHLQIGEKWFLDEIVNKYLV